jgi:tetratricopeptide (TPR) repeat protein
VLFDQGRYGECKELALTSADSIGTPNGPDQARVMYRPFLAAVCSRIQGDLERSESQLWRILEKHLEISGEVHPLTPNILIELSHILRATGRTVEAVSLLERSYRRMIEIFGIGASNTLIHCLKLGNAYEALGRYQDAHALYLRSLDHF